MHHVSNQPLTAQIDGWSRLLFWTNSVLPNVVVEGVSGSAALDVLTLPQGPSQPGISRKIHGNGIYLPTWMVDLYGKLVGKYTSHMDLMGIAQWPLTQHLLIEHLHVGCITSLKCHTRLNQYLFLNDIFKNFRLFLSWRGRDRANHSNQIIAHLLFI